jgi:hypothetical protein
MSSKRIVPSRVVQTTSYNEAGFIPHPLQHFGSPGGAASDIGRAPVAGVTGNSPGQPAYGMAGIHEYHTNG